MATLIQLDAHHDKGGQLTVLEKKLPFDIKRIFYITDQNPDQTRARHANRVLQEGLICLVGSCEVMLDDGSTKETVRLDNKEECLLIESMRWIEISHFSEDCVLLVLASEYYDDADHIHDYALFQKEVRLRS
jgi:hypothetical protein